MTSLGRTLSPLLLALIFAGCSGSTGPDEAADRSHEGLASLPAGLLGINIDPANPMANPARADLDAVGVRRVRIEFKIAYQGGSADAELASAFATYDPIVTQRIGAGVGVLFILDYQTLSTERSGDWASDGFRNDFAARAAAVAAHYAPLGIDHFEIWNEQDLCVPGYCPRVDPGPYAALLGAAASAIHGANPGARVALGGLGSGQWETYLGDVVGAMGGTWSEVDAVGVHPYVHWPAASGMGQSVEYLLDRCHQIGHRPLWMTEWGDSGQQAATEKAYFKFFRSGSAEASYVEEAYLFAWSDAQHDAPDAFGLFDRSGNKKDAEWNAFHDAAGGGTPSNPPPPPPPPSGPSCGQLAAQNGWTNALCEWNGNGACGGQGTPTSDCDHCCDASAPPPPPPPPPSKPSCGQLAAQNGWTDALCEWNGNGACGGQGPATSDCDHCCEAGSPPPPPPPPSSACPCNGGADNFCLYPPNTAGCDMTAPGGYCDPNGDGSYDDADWVRGYDEYHQQCG
jgi:hypothetical protein